MKLQILEILILTLALSCNTKQESQPKFDLALKNKTLEKPIKDIHLNFTAKRMSDFKETIEIKASLYNNNPDTVYLLTSTCEGEQYSLKYDTTRFELTPFLNCNVSYPIIIPIAPKDEYSFRAHFKRKDEETKIRLGFDFYKVDKSVDVKNKNLGDINIFNRPKEEQTVIWSEIVEIKE